MSFALDRFWRTMTVVQSLWRLMLQSLLSSHQMLGLYSRSICRSATHMFYRPQFQWLSLRFSIVLGNSIKKVLHFRQGPGPGGCAPVDCSSEQAPGYKGWCHLHQRAHHPEHRGELHALSRRCRRPGALSGPSAVLHRASCENGTWWALAVRDSEVLHGSSVVM